MNHSDISIITQGSISPITKAVLEKLRTAFPSTELILSTWENSDIAGIDADKIILSPDPGCSVADSVAGTLNNVNRQLVSTQAGIRAATRPYILKTRTDILFDDAEFLSYFNRFDDRPSHYFKNRLLICNYYTRNPRIIPVCFHPSDWIVFGRAEDVRKYYENIPLMTPEECSWFLNHEKTSTFFTNYICRFTPEQHIFMNFLRQYEDISCSQYYDAAPISIKQTERAFAQCFVVLDYQQQLNIEFSKYDPNRYLEAHTLISHRQWKALYQHYCKKRPSLLWFEYRFKGLILNCLSHGRTFCIRVLDRLGVKERVKGLLRARRS